MLFHAVLFNFKDDLPDDKKEHILQLARDMLPPIPGVMNLMAGKNIKPDSEYEYSITMYFDDEAALQEYRDHPEHVKFRDAEFFPFVGSKIGIDYIDHH
ncbi:Dabb family protein [bacterium]